MLFGNNPWGGRKPPTMQPQQPPASPPIMQPQPQYQAPTWAAQTPDLAYSGGLANYFSGQLQNQQVPGSFTPQTQIPVQQQPPQPAPAPAPMPGQGPGGWRDAFHSAMQDWRGLRPAHGSDVFAQWQQGRPVRQDYRQGGM